ncbi:hypothetical protein NBH08_25760 [Faecalicatena sp. BF-R-105]|nr:hypothetical protein [Faecalicatena sp. BF-R-105]
MPKPYYRLRFELHERDIDQVTLAEKLHRGDSYISDRMNGKGSWSLREAFEMMRLLDVPLEQIADYFPPGDVGRRNGA